MSIPCFMVARRNCPLSCAFTCCLMPLHMAWHNVGGHTCAFPGLPLMKVMCSCIFHPPVSGQRLFNCAAMHVELVMNPVLVLANANVLPSVVINPYMRWSTTTHVTPNFFSICFVQRTPRSLPRLDVRGENTYLTSTVSRTILYKKSKCFLPCLIRGSISSWGIRG